MTASADQAYLLSLVRELCKLPHETDWVEFKLNQDAPQEIGEYISALANAATLQGKAQAYLLWGVENGTHVITTQPAGMQLRLNAAGASPWAAKLRLYLTGTTSESYRRYTYHYCISNYVT